ncbi:MAG TPA: hypothetical protein VH520_03265 [Streptosporangiaceae bacterium]|jgi:hypothetical protein
MLPCPPLRLPVQAREGKLAGDPRTWSWRSLVLLVSDGGGHGRPARSGEGTTSGIGTAAADGTARLGSTRVVVNDWRALSHETVLCSWFRRAGRQCSTEQKTQLL